MRNPTVRLRRHAPSPTRTRSRGRRGARLLPVAVLASLGLLTASLATTPASADDVAASGVPASSTASSPAPGAADPAARTAKRPSAREADAALGTARRVLDGAPRTGDASPSLALRDLYLALPRLTGGERSDAESLLGRPTDGARDPYGDGYRTASRRMCSEHFCIHWVTSTSDAPPSSTWVRSTLRVMDQVWSHHVDRLGYRAPLGDGKRGGDSRFDVYLADVGADGYYGYCAPEKAPSGGNAYVTTGFCVLDNDFEEFAGSPIESRKVTAAHEFFHAIQYAYDAAEDRWFMEATATWMEERFADEVDDNRQYLTEGQNGRPTVPLDTFTDKELAPYGNWTFFEYLTLRFGQKIVRDTWTRAGAFRGGLDLYSTASVIRALNVAGTSLTRTYAAYAGGNTVPDKTYPEGAAWPTARTAKTWTMSSRTPEAARWSTSIDHLASTTATFVPRYGFADASWRLALRLTGPRTANVPSAVVIVHRTNGSITKQLLTFAADGTATGRTNFSSASTAKVTVTLVNSSARFDCDQGTSYSCEGEPLDDDQAFTLAGTATQG